MAEVADTWSPAQYNKFAAEREQPFWDLAALVEGGSGAGVVDLGCGDGRLTAALHARLGASATIGIDSSAAMLAAAPVVDGVTFVQRDIATFDGPPVDIVYANASLQWVPEHVSVLRRWAGALRPGGHLAIQVPYNADHPSHTVAEEVGAEMLADPPHDAVGSNVLRPEDYAVLLHELGFDRQLVRLQVYGHVLDSTADVVEWMKGTALTRFRRVMDDEQYATFVAEFGRRLVGVLGDRSPYFYPFKRILLWGRLPPG